VEKQPSPAEGGGVVGGQALVVVQQTVKAAHEVDYPLVVFVNQFVHVTLNLVGIVIILYLLH